MRLSYVVCVKLTVACGMDASDLGPMRPEDSEASQLGYRVFRVHGHGFGFKGLGSRFLTENDNSSACRDRKSCEMSQASQN